MSDYESTSDLNEAIYYEKLDADREMAEFERQGNAYAKEQRIVKQLLADGKRGRAVQVCRHGHIGKLDGTCSIDDPRYMQEGYRCYECGAVVSEMFGGVLHDE